MVTGHLNVSVTAVVYTRRHSGSLIPAVIISDAGIDNRIGGRGGHILGAGKVEVPSFGSRSNPGPHN